MVNVILAGASGRTGREIARAAVQAEDIQVLGAIGEKSAGKDLGAVIGLGALGTPVVSDPGTLDAPPGTVWIDFTRASAARIHVPRALRRRWHAVVGTTGLTPDDLAEFAQAADEGETAAAVIANFSLGAVLSQRLAALAFGVFPHAEIVELHGSHKLDRPSATATALAADLALQGSDTEDEPPHIPIHSVRLPGLVAHQEVLFGGAGESVTIRHDVYGRDAYVAGTLATVRRIAQFRGLITRLTDVWDGVPGRIQG